MTVTCSKQLFSLSQFHSSNFLVISLHPHSIPDHRPTVQMRKLTYREDAKLHAQTHCLSAARAIMTPGVLGQSTLQCYQLLNNPHDTFLPK